MKTRASLRVVLTVLSCAALAACAAQGAGTPSTPQVAAPAFPLALHAHWNKTSIGKFSDPYGVAVDASGTVYVADPGSKSIVKIEPDGARSTFGDFAVAGRDKFDPQGLAIASAPYALFVADRGNSEIWYVKPDGSVGSVYASKKFPNYPRGVAYTPGSGGVLNVAVATALPLSSKGYVACTFRKCPFFTSKDFANPYGLALDDQGRTYVADAGSKTVYRIDKDGDLTIDTFADPYGVAVTANGSRVYVADAGAKKVYEIANGVRTEIGTFGDPYGVAVAPNGDVYVADPGSKDVWKLTP